MTLLLSGVATTLVVATVAALLSRLNLADSAAWATIGALFVGILTLALGLVQLLCQPKTVALKAAGDSAAGASDEPASRHRGAGRDEFNIGSVGTFNVNNHDS